MGDGFRVGGSALGENVHRVSGPVGVGGAIVGAALLLVGVVVLRRNEKRLTEEAERALPGPLDGEPPRRQTHVGHGPAGTPHLVEKAHLIEAEAKG